MWKPTKPFSLILLLLVLITFGEELKERLTVKVKVQEIIELRKPELELPDKLSYRLKSYEIVNVQGKLLEPPKEIEEGELYLPKEGGCGAPKDLNLYKRGVEAYQKGDLYTAEKALTDLLAIPNSPFANPAKYLLGLIKYKKVQYTEALKLFEEACNTMHFYTAPACESFFALYLKLYDKAYPAKTPELWKTVYTIREENTIPKEALKCENFTFKKYCSYVDDFIQGRVNLDYRESTEIRRAILLFENGNYAEAKEVLERYKSKLLPYRDVVIYYLGLIALAEENYDEALGNALLLETLNEKLANNLYIQIALRKPEISDYAYERTKDKWILSFSGVKAYNEGNYQRALVFLKESGEYLYATYAALKLRDYQLAYELLKKIEQKDEHYYELLLEVLYKLGRDEEFLQVLNEIRYNYPELYEEYYGWYFFKQKDWERAAGYFKNPIHKAIALYNAGKYEKVLEILKDNEEYEARILKAKAAIALGRTGLARRFLYGETPEEIYLLGFSYFVEGNYEKAISFFEKLLKDPEYKLRAMLRLADSYYNLGQRDRARALYSLITKEFKNSPEAREALIALAQIEAQAPTKNLEELLGEFIRLYPNSPIIPELRLQLAKIYAQEGRKKEAEIILRKLLKDPDYGDLAALELAKITDDKKEKEEVLLSLLNSKKEEVRKEAFSMLSEFYEKEGELLKFAKLLERENPEAQVKAIELYLKLGKVEDAEKVFRRLYTKNKNWEELKELALSLYEKTGKVGYLQIAYSSKKPEIALRAAYLLGVYYSDKDSKKALEYLAEVIYSEKKELPFYKSAVLTSGELLKKLNAFKDASCILKKLSGIKLEKEEEEKLLKLKEGLPPCEG